MIKGYADLKGTIEYFKNKQKSDNWVVKTDRLKEILDLCLQNL